MAKKYLVALASVMLILLVAGCGGGGGGGSGSGGSSGSKGGFTLDKTSASFKLDTNAAQTQDLSIHVTGSKVAYIGAAYDTGQTPASWLELSVAGAGADYKLSISASAYGLAAKTYSAQFTVGSADSDGNVLEKKVVSVNLVVTNNFSFVESLNSLSVVQGASANGKSLALKFNGQSGLSWNASSDASWLVIQNASGTGPGELNCSLDSQGLASGIYTAHVKISDTNDESNTGLAEVKLYVVDPLVFTETQGQLTYVNALLPNDYKKTLDVFADANTQWTLSSDQSWLSIAYGPLTGSQSPEVAVSQWQLMPGDYTAVITAQDINNNANRSQYTLNVHVQPKIEISPDVNAAVAQLAYKQFIYGSSENNATLVLPFSAGDLTQWQMSASQDWLSFDTDAGSGSASVNAFIDVSKLGPGSFDGSITIADKEYTDNKQNIDLNVSVLAPELNLSSDNLVLGGEDGIGSREASLTFAVNTGTNAYPYSIAVETENHQDWLKVDTANGNVSAAGVTALFSADAEALHSGIYKASVTLTAQVNLITLTKTIAVTLNKEANRLVVSSQGVAFTASPSKSVLSRTLNILSSIARNDVTWSASSDQSWLSVTPSGTTGGALVLTADDSLLAAGSTYFATVTVSSSDVEVENEETIRVGLTVLADDPLDVPINIDTDKGYGDFAVGMVQYGLVASPVEPLVFINLNNQIKAYNVFTGMGERTFPQVTANAGSMTISQDGAYLFVYDLSNHEVVELDSASGEVVHRYPATYTGWGNISDLMPGYIRPAGHALLAGAGDYIYDLDSQQVINSSSSPSVVGYSLSTNQRPDWLAANDGSLYQYKYSALDKGDGVLSSESISHVAYAEGAPGQACVNSQSTRVYTASGAPYYFPGVGIQSQNLEQSLPGTAYPNALQCGWNGLVIGGASAYYDAEDIFVYDSETGNSLGNLSSSTKTGYRALLNRGLALSGDNQRIIALSINNGSPNFVQIHFMNLP